MKTVMMTMAGCLVAAVAAADPLVCSLTGYKAAPGLTARAADNAIALTWSGEGDQELELRFIVEGGSPVIERLAVRRRGGTWATLGSNLKPEYRVVTGFRRMTNQQMQPLNDLKVPITPEIIEKYKWDAFWDAPLDLSAPAQRRPGGPGVPGGPAGAAPAAPGATVPPAAPAGFGGNPPPAAGIAGQPGLPRKPEEIHRASAQFTVTGCEVKTDGSHLEIWFPGATLGPFSGRLQYTVYKGSNLIRQEIAAETSETTIAYKYDSGLAGFAVAPTSHLVWRDTSNLWQNDSFGGAKNDQPVVLKAANRTLVAELAGGSVAAFPPPHSFFWSREIAINLGYTWYRKDSATSFAFGIRQSEQEDPSENPANFALYSARPHTLQRMPMFFYASAAAGQATMQSALAFTRQDHYKPLPGYQVMATHFHTSMPQRLKTLGGVDARINDLDAFKAIGVNIWAPVDGGRVSQANRLEELAFYFEAARRHSDKTFLVMPNEESDAGGLGGHNDVFLSKPTFWTYGRKDGQPFEEKDPKYGTVYHVGSPADMMEVAKRENLLVFMPHPRSKGSTGFPDAMKDTPQFNSENYRGIGMRWGMGLDGSELRLCEIRCQTLLDDMNNWLADKPGPLKFVQAITETYENHPGDDVYASNPVNYLKIALVPSVDDMSSIINAMKKGDYFWSSGEVLIPNWSVKRTGKASTIVADVEWTYPLAFVEVVWGDGVKTERQVISTTDLGAFGTKHFEIPFDATGKKWVRFAAWDVATNGAMVQPVRVNPAGR